MAGQRSIVASSIARVGALSLVVLALLASATGIARAHSGVESYVYLELFDDAIEGEVHYPINDLNEILGLSIDAEGTDLEAQLQGAAGTITAYTREHLAMFGDDGPWPLTIGEVRPLGAEVGYAVVDFAVDQTFGTVPRVFDVEYSGIIVDKPERAALLIIATDFGSGTFNNEADHLLVYDEVNLRQTVDLGDTSLATGVAATIRLGAEHIQIGFDHILFILALVLPSVLVFRRDGGWAPTPTFGSGLWRVIKIATSFTVAHTITLTLGGLGLVELPGSIVEPVIALSIALAALHNIRPVFFNKEWALAFAFGLFHGFGFAGLLADLGLTRSNQVVSLLGFNIGIELGQIVVILLVFPALYLLSRTRTYVLLMTLGSVGLVVASLGWFAERVFGVDLGVTWLVTRALAWPRPLYLAAILTVAAVAYWYRERSLGRLVDVRGDDGADAEPSLVTSS